MKRQGWRPKSARIYSIFGCGGGVEQGAAKFLSQSGE